ncbi:MAG: hypothetical protein M1838_002746, partial [Thelocarpon superellum]
YGFRNVVTPADIITCYPSIWPFATALMPYYASFARPLPRPINPVDPASSLQIDAIFVYNDPRDWALDIQVMLDLLLSHRGILGTLSPRNNDASLPNRGFQQDGQPPLYLSNPDLWWAAEYHLPRLGQGGFREALEGVWTAVTGGKTSGVELKKTLIGKPHRATYEFAERRLNEHRMILQQPAGEDEDEDGALPSGKTGSELERVYMIGDNPASDIMGANEYQSPRGTDPATMSLESNVGAMDLNPTEPSPSALKKLAKAKEKEEKKAAKRKELDERQRQQQQQAAADDFAKDNYGRLPEVRPSTIVDLSDLVVDSTVTVQTSVQNIRSQTAKLCFLLLRQSPFSTIQAVVAAGDDSSSVSRPMVKWVASLNSESVVEITGLVHAPKDPVTSATISALELHVQKIYLVAEAVAQFPMSLESALLPELGEGEKEDVVDGADSKTSKTPRVNLATRLDNRVIDMRTPTNQAIFMIKGGVKELFREYLRKHAFVEVDTPKLIPAASEGGSNVFAVNYFGRNVYLAQSPQLYKQMLVNGGLHRVFETGSIFRAENSNTARHMTEFIGLDMEMTFKVHYHEVLDMLEGLFIYIFKGLKERYSTEIEMVRRQYPVEEFKLPEDGKMLRLNFVEGMAMLRAAGEDISDHDDMTTPQERHLGRLVRERYGTDFYILDQFPLAIRPFYTMPSPHDPRLSNSYDFFMRGEEIMSGAQRIHQHGLLLERMKAVGVDPDGDGLKDYVDSFKYGAPPHGGGGIGLERVIFLYLGLGNIRKASTFPRDPHRVRP